ncbi:hypothetical protein SAMN05421856_10467 [Chryseobacterium taichungense]|uniref:Uncharacterized protein n=1 Tax=Chryseobacterium taichungense TaxID=295069 RepID=A0A1H7Z8R1_9FLAO|nr:hypothetical protein [Chryseobacterium taichungense]SEM53879.1 hypothetical protein SAMN05421856_10467 [Chryseobacterium taichungense]
MKNIITLAVLFISLTAFAQVGINNTSPKATLDISPNTIDGSKPEGLLIPQLDGNSLKTTAYGTSQKGVIVYAKSAASPTDTKTVNVTTEGYYFYDGSVWQKMTGAAAGDTTNDAWVNDTTNGLVKLGTKADGTVRAVGADFVAKDNGQVGIGTSSPDASAALEVASTNKGMLIPRVALTGSTDQTTIPSPATGLMAYNTGAAGLAFKGFVFWNGTEWRSVNNNPTISPTITSLKCTDAYLEPNTLSAGVAYTGVLKVPYTGGNAGLFSGGTGISSTVNTGLTATLNSGELESGSGVLSYTVSGTPSQNSPIVASFNLGSTVFGATGCTVSVGDEVGTNVTTKKIIYTSANANAAYTVKMDDLEFKINPDSGTYGIVYMRFTANPNLTTAIRGMDIWQWSNDNQRIRSFSISTTTANSLSWAILQDTNGDYFNNALELQFTSEVIVPGRNNLYKVYATRFRSSGSNGIYVLTVTKY